MEERWHVGRRLEETCMGRPSQWWRTIKGKVQDLQLMLGDGKFKENKKGECAT